MPEGAEVKKFADLFKPLIGDEISIILRAGKYATSPDPLAVAFRNGVEKYFPRKLTDAWNHGKILVLEFGEIKLICQPMLKGKFSKDETGSILFRGATTIGFTDSISLARFQILGSVQLNKILEELGPDVSNPVAGDAEKFCTKLQRRSTYIYKLLLDQKISSGTGNYMRAEAIYDSGINPLAKAKEITAQQCRALYDSLVKIAAKKYNGTWKFKVYKQPDAIALKDGQRTFWHK